MTENIIIELEEYNKLKSLQEKIKEIMNYLDEIKNRAKNHDDIEKEIIVDNIIFHIQKLIDEKYQ